MRFMVLMQSEFTTERLTATEICANKLFRLATRQKKIKIVKSWILMVVSRHFALRENELMTFSWVWTKIISDL